MKKDKWEVLCKLDDDNEEPEKFDDNGKLSNRELSDFYESSDLDYEISIIRKNYKLGHESWGWNDEDKIILFGSGIGANRPRTLEEAMKIAKIVCDALNEKGI